MLSNTTEYNHSIEKFEELPLMTEEYDEIVETKMSTKSPNFKPKTITIRSSPFQIPVAVSTLQEK